MLPTFVVNNLYEERAILFSRLEQHKDALRTYVYDMNDTQLAEDYCKKFYDPQNDKRSDVYLYLLNVYLRPDKNMQQQLQPALQLLSKHFDKINPAEAFELLPTEITINEMLRYFECVLRNMAEKKKKWASSGSVAQI